MRLHQPASSLAGAKADGGAGCCFGAEAAVAEGARLLDVGLVGPLLGLLPQLARSSAAARPAASPAPSRNILPLSWCATDNKVRLTQDAHEEWRR